MMSPWRLGEYSNIVHWINLCTKANTIRPGSMQRPSGLDPCKDHQAWIHAKTIRPGSMQRPSGLDPCKDHQAWIHAKTIRPGSMQRPSGLDPCKDHQAWIHAKTIRPGYVYLNEVFLTRSGSNSSPSTTCMLQSVNTTPYISSYM